MNNPVLSPNTKGWKILTPNGFESFGGVSYNGEQNTVEIRFVDGTTLRTTPNHPLLKAGRTILSKSVKPGMRIDGIGKKTVVSVGLTGLTERVFDIIHTESHTYLVEGVASHNCRFVSSDPLLIDSLKAQLLKSRKPRSVNHGINIWIPFERSGAPPTAPQAKTGSVAGSFDNWYHKADPYATASQSTTEYDRQCIMTVDPSKGVGGDFTAIEVFSYPELEQMMEFRSNITKTGEIYKHLRYLWEKARQAGWGVMFTVENNGVGEGIITLFENDDQLPDNVEMISDEGRQIGMNTNTSTKLQACKIFKEFVEGDKFKFHSADLIREVKTYAKVGATYAAQQGSTDDCVSACLLVCRILKMISSYDDEAYKKLYEVGQLEDDAEVDEYTEGGDDDFLPMVF